jgi:enoyl-CoA hydratase/carnithine racemase
MARKSWQPHFGHSRPTLPPAAAAKSASAGRTDGSLPFFGCKAVGDVLLAAAQSYPKCQILVLCGHTHGGGELQVAANLRVVTGPAEYGKPEVQRVIEVA